jgi:hypothetical protein
MALKLPKNAEKKPMGMFYLEKEGIYKFLITENEDKVDTKEGSKRKGYSLHVLKIKAENEKTTLMRIYYQNEEGNIVPEGYNFIIDLKTIISNSAKEEGNEKLLKKLEDADSNKVIDYFIKNAIPIYLATKNSIYNGENTTNINSYIPPMGSLEEAEEVAEKKKLTVIHLETKKEIAPEAEDDGDDDL